MKLAARFLGQNDNDFLQPSGNFRRVMIRIIIHSASADASADLSADMPEDRVIKLKILLKHSRML